MKEKRLETLEAILKQVIDWLKFAEAKNGALVAVGCAVIFGSFRVYSTLSVENSFIIVYLVCIIVFVAASVIIALTSFVPRMTPPFWIQMPPKEAGDNPLFFGHACKYSKSTYLDLFNRHVDGHVSDEVILELALCDQIVNNSKISYIKYRMFGSAVLLFIAGVLTPVGALVLYWVLE
jgi:hypothetical protein